MFFMRQVNEAVSIFASYDCPTICGLPTASKQLLILNKHTVMKNALTGDFGIARIDCFLLCFTFRRH